jgi:hypothetical protein
MAEHRGRLVGIWAFGIDSSRVQDGYGSTVMAPQNVAKENVLGLGLDILIAILYWSSLTKFKVLNVMFMTVLFDEDMVKDVGVSDETSCFDFARDNGPDSVAKSSLATKNTQPDDPDEIRTNKAKDSNIILPASCTVRYFPAIRRRSSRSLGTAVSCYKIDQMSDSAN